MAAPPELPTPRLRLRGWRPSDEPVLDSINRDPEVARYLNRPLGPGVTRAFLAYADAHWAEHGYGIWALESREEPNPGRLLGFAGLGHPDFIPELARRVEIGWRLARSAWGRGLATEAALATRDYATEVAGLRELISIIHPQNRRSQRVAEKLGMVLEGQVMNPVLRIPVDVWQLTLGGEGPNAPSARN